MPAAAFPDRPPARSPRWRRGVRLLLLGLVTAWLVLAVYHRYKPLPAGIGVAMPERPVTSVAFLADYTWADGSGERRVEQRIFDRVLELIDGARQLIVLDMFLFNDFAGSTDGDDMRALSCEVERALLARRQSSPEVRIVLLTDPINELYGGVESARLKRLRRAGVDVIVTRLSRLRDSNPTWSGFWRLCCAWAGNASDGGWLPNPVGPGRVSLRTWLRLLNFKANHRKTLIVDTADGWTGLVTSGNPHDASSAHGNVALEFSGPAALDLLATERAVAAFSGGLPDGIPEPTAPGNGAAGSARLQVLTEAAVRDASIAAIDAAGPGDRVDLAMFYLSHRGVIRALVRAAERGVAVRALLDPNRDAFGKRKDGIPNRPVARELVDHGVAVRWCRTQGEQCHSKLLQVRYADGRSELIVGSANFTRRNLDDLNLETSVRLAAPIELPAMAEAQAYFERRWSNLSGRLHSLPYPAFAEDSGLRYWRYRLMEFSGLSTF